MAFDQDGFFNDTFVKLFRQTITIDIGSTTPGVFKGALFQASITPNFSQTNPAYGSAPWNSGEPTGQPGYTTGGENLTVISFAELAGAANMIGWRFQTVTWSSATFAAEGLLVYAPSLSNRAFVFRWFGQSYDASNGDYEINPHTDGITRYKMRNAA
ncbi:hypothetical protein MF672_010905 [Actinomadura sp. ATCC 31491]|uniref:Uncharacterized protein n=1 Tax=Actinomadura luzonensis TaxID=2805427 RepID=A0ABT0FPT1_9ACTN|nr:hypothetical protein [Actinomadura luzonensis]MCK2214296.1 hypothetical protein [Actinomadura luzonensis]